MQKAGCIVRQSWRCAGIKKRETSDLVRFVRSKLESRGCTITKDCCDLLIERCEKDMLTLNAEIEKLGAYARGSVQQDDGQPVAITVQMIETVTCKTVSGSVYDLAKAILADRFEKQCELWRIYSIFAISQRLFWRHFPVLIWIFTLQRQQKHQGQVKRKLSRTFPIREEIL